MSRDLSDLRIAVLMIDGIVPNRRTNVVALGISTEGEKLALGLWQGSTENGTVAQALVSDPRRLRGDLWSRLIPSGSDQSLGSLKFRFGRSRQWSSSGIGAIGFTHGPPRRHLPARPATRR